MFNEAISDFSTALVLDPKLSSEPTGAMVYVSRGGAYLATNQISLARADFLEALKVGKDEKFSNGARQGLVAIDSIKSQSSFTDNIRKAIEFGKAHWFLTLTSLIVLMLAIGRWRSVVRNRRDFRLIDMADAWFREHEIEPSSLRFNAYTNAVLVKNRNAVVFVGTGQSPGQPKGFIIEVDQKLGVVDGFIVSDAAASWSKLRAKRGRLPASFCRFVSRA